MDTRFWGPSGWRLLHLISFTYEPNDLHHARAVERVFTLLPYVLPCKFCRESLSIYMEEDPLVLTSRAAFSKWLWRIHNKVNAKLRSQGLVHDADPSFDAVKKVYEERVAAGCVRTDFEGWDFLFSLAENHPYAMSTRNSLPIEREEAQRRMGMSTLSVEESLTLRNRLNRLTPDERFEKYAEFWSHIGAALPFKEWRDAWADCGEGEKEKAMKARSSWIRYLWKVRCCLEKKLELVNRDTYASVCKRLVEHRSGCGKKKRAKTCRKEKRGGYNKRSGYSKGRGPASRRKTR
jgi:hypothetical protein